MTPHASSLNRHRHQRARDGRAGFALVVTISLMVLLLVLGVGLLSLSAVTLRASSQGEALATARANARLALLLALGELQLQAGADQRVTARADILDDKLANPRLTGVWNSWEIRATEPPAARDYDASTKAEKFRGWLVSGRDPKETRKADFARQPPTDPAELLGRGTLGDKSPATDRVSASKVPLAATPGAFAWAVLDEGVKARVNTPYIPEAASRGLQTAQLGSGVRPGIEFITGLDPLDRDQFALGSPDFQQVEKGLSQANFGIAAEHLAAGTREALRPLGHDLTTRSLGLFTDTARGGLREDLQLLTTAKTLPANYNRLGVYQSRLGLGASDIPSDPRWDTLQQFATIYRSRNLAESAGAPLLKGIWPTGWQASTQSGTPVVTTVNRRPPPGAVLMPTIAKVQVLFSLIGRDLYDYPPPAGNVIPPEAPVFHNPQGTNFKNTKYNYDLHLMYTPVVTLHNPYNVALEFYKMRVEFVHTPFAMQVFRNGVPQSTSLVPVETMYADNESGSLDKTFGMNLKTKTSAGTPGSTTFRLLPGETKMFSPYIDPNRTYRDEFRSSRQAWDIYVGTGITTNIDAIPGWRGDGIGYSCDWLAGAYKQPEDFQQGRWAGCYGLARDDQIHVLFAPLSVPQYSKNKFVVRVTAATTASGTPVSTNAIEIDYEKPTGLQDLLLGRGQTLRFPKTGTIRGIDLVDHSTEPIKNLQHIKPFALLSLQAKTTSGGRDASNEDGRFAAKPWCFAHGNVAGTSQKAISEHPANHSHEIDFQRLDNGTANLLQIDSQDRGNFITGHTAFNGSKFGALYEIPLHPVQTPAGLNGANLGGLSGYLPRVAQPIGNSWAHPLLPADRMIAPSAGGALADHSFLLNLAFYDGFYSSGLAEQTGPFGNGRTTADLAARFAGGEPLDDPRLVFHQPNGRPADDFAKDAADANAHARIAAWQLLQGSFNINSTSVAAWKAMLASVHDPKALLVLINKGARPGSGGSASFSDLPATGEDEVRISRFRLPASTSAADGADPRDAYWLGPREFSESQLQALAENLVEQVRKRGPFLSLGEFVNRRLSSDEFAQCGALQQAIDQTGINQALAGTANAGFEIPAAAVANHKYANPTAGTGPSYQGAPGFLCQADLLNVLGNAATARSDTFVIRAYGEARDATGKPLAKAWCEASVQRLPEWIDPADPVETAPASLASAANKSFGRRFLITSFRWLAPNEV